MVMRSCGQLAGFGFIVGGIGLSASALARIATEAASAAAIGDPAKMTPH